MRPQQISRRSPELHSPTSTLPVFRRYLINLRSPYPYSPRSSDQRAAAPPNAFEKIAPPRVHRARKTNARRTFPEFCVRTFAALPFFRLASQEFPHNFAFTSFNFTAISDFL